MSDYEIKLLEPTSYDTRLIDRHIAEGRIDQNDVKKRLDSLPDLADEGEEFTVVLGEDEEGASK